MRHSTLRLPGLRRSPASRLSILAAFTLIAGCQGSVTTDLATELPANPNINQVAASVRGLQFTTSNGTKNLEFTASERLNFIDYASDGKELRMFTSERLRQGTYTGVRLLFDDGDRDNGLVTRLDGTQYQMKVTDGDYAAVQFEVKENDDDNESFTLMLDLRQSLSFDTSNLVYTLKPILRAVDTGDISRIQGNITATCGNGDALSRGAVYLFKGKNVTPDDIDGSGVEPFATAPVLIGQGGNSFIYTLRVLPEGDYTLALTCRGNDDDPLKSENLDFRDINNIELDSNQTLTFDLT